MNSVYLIVSIVALILLTIIGIISRFRKCPSDKIMVVYGKTGSGKSAKCVHGGATFIIPFIQGYKLMSLEPLQFVCKLEKALSSQNIRVDVPSTVTVGISTDPTTMQAAAERLLSLNSEQIEGYVKDIVYGQMRLIISNMTIEELNSERDKFLAEVRKVIGNELAKLGLDLININITDINDEAGYIKALGQKDRAIAINKANVDIASAERDGATQQAELNKDKNTKVAETRRDEEVSVAAANADKESRVANAAKEREINVAKAKAEAEIGKIEAQKTVVDKNAELEVAKAEAKVQQEQELALKVAEEARAIRNAAAIHASTIVPAEKAKEEARLKAEAIKVEMETKAEAVANQDILLAEGKAQAEALRGEGEAKAILAKGDAEAEVIRKKGLAEAESQKASLEAQAEGFRKMIEAAKTDPTIAIQFKMVEEGTYEKLAEKQAEAFKHMKFGNVQIMDTSKGSSLTGLMSDLISTVAPVMNIAKNIPGMPKSLSDKLLPAKEDFPEVK